MAYSNFRLNIAIRIILIFSILVLKAFWIVSEYCFREIQSKNINLLIKYDGKPETFRGDPDLLEQVLINLIRNAAEAVESMENPRITLVVEEIPGYQVKIKVEDNGPGMNKETLDKIFVPFFSTKSEGTRIGLSLSRQIIMMHKGSIEVTSKLGKGSVFEVLM